MCILSVFTISFTLILTSVVCVLTWGIFKIASWWEHVLWWLCHRGPNRTLCSQGKCFLNRHSLGHLLRENAVLWDARGVLDVLNRHSLGPPLKADTVFVNRTPCDEGKCVADGASPRGGHCVMGRTLCSRGIFFLNRHSLGHLFMADAVLRDVRCVLQGSIF